MKAWDNASYCARIGKMWCREKNLTYRGNNFQYVYYKGTLPDGTESYGSTLLYGIENELRDMGIDVERIKSICASS